MSKLILAACAALILNSALAAPAAAQRLLTKYYYNENGVKVSLKAPSYCPWGSKDSCERAAVARKKYYPQQILAFCHLQCGALTTRPASAPSYERY